MKKALFVTYYWIPSGKASLHFPLGMIKHLPESGWQSSVLTVDEDTFPHKDYSLLNELKQDVKTIRSRSFEPFELYKKFTGKEKDAQLVPSETISTTNRSITHLISIWIRMNLFIPDARVGWYFDAVKQGAKYLRDEKVDAIISVGPPHTGHLIGMRLAKKFSIPFYPVFIDPWLDIIYYRNFRRSKVTLAIDNRLEKKVLRFATRTIFVTDTMRKNYVDKYSFLKDKSNVLYWGYNNEAFNGFTPVQPETETIVHAGNIFDYQNIPAFWNKVKELNNIGRRIKVKFIGTVSPLIKAEITKYGLDEFTEYAGFLPYDEMLKELARASYLLVCATEPRHVPGKLFEYLRTGKPIIAFGEDNSEVKEIIEKANAGMMFSYKEDAARFFENPEKFKTDMEFVKRFDRRNIAGELARLLS